MLKEQPQMTVSAEQLAKELRDVRSEFEGLRRQVKTIGGRTSALYVAA